MRENFGSQELREEKLTLPKELGISICSHQKLGFVRERKQEGVLVDSSPLRHPPLLNQEGVLEFKRTVDWSLVLLEKRTEG